MRLEKAFKNKRGFSLVELIIVIVVLGLLAVSVGSRFDGKRGFAEFAYQGQLISVLRVMQTRAMFDTRPGYCFQVNFTTEPSAFGPPALNYGSDPISATCLSTIDHTLPAHLATNPTEMTENSVLLSLPFDGVRRFNTVGFDHWGRPVDVNKNRICATGCRINLSSEQVIGVCIEAEGYIYACQ